MEKPTTRDRTETLKTSATDTTQVNYSTVYSSYGTKARKVKEDVLGYYLDKATKMVQSSCKNSSDSTNPFSIARSSSFDYDIEKTYQTPNRPSRVVRLNRNSVFTARKGTCCRNSMIHFEENMKIRKTMGVSKNDKRSMIVNHGENQLLDVHYSSRGRNALSKIRKQTSLGLDTLKYQPEVNDTEADELKKFIELEDYCRRTTENSKMPSAKKPQKKKAGKKTRSRAIKNAPHMVKTFSIAI